MASLRSNRYVNKSITEFQEANRSPIYGYKKQMLVTLEESAEKLHPFVNDIMKYVDDAKQKCNRQINLLTWDESAAIYLYTMSTPFFSALNDTLRAEDRHALKPWFPFLRLFLNALEKLPSSATTVWRAVSGDTDNYSLQDDVKIWWSVNSSSTALNVVQIYLGERGTLFAIETTRGKKIDEYSAFPDEQEVIIMPGTFLKIESEPLNFIDRLLVVHLKEEAIGQQHHETTNLNPSPSTNVLLPSLPIENFGITDQSRLLLSESSQNVRSFSKLSKCHLIVSLIFAILIPGASFGILVKTLFFSYSSTYSSNSIRVDTRPMSTIPTDSMYVPIRTCSPRQFHIEANILYSFDCSSVTDEIQDKYNGVVTRDLWNSYYSEFNEIKAPTYVSPDYSGVGSAIQFHPNSSKYVPLVQSPILFNQSFTLSFWVNPNIEVSQIYGLVNQIYVTAPSFNISIIEEYVVMSIYGTSLWSTKKLKNNQWQYLSFVFNEKNISMSIFIDGILNVQTSIGHHPYGNYRITQTTFGSLQSSNKFHGLIDQLSIFFDIKSPSDILNEATLVVHYTFQDDNIDSEFLLRDHSVNSINAHGSHISHSIGNNRIPNRNVLCLYNSILSDFHTSNFLLLSTFNYSYSYSLWIHISNQSSSAIPLLHFMKKLPLQNDCLNLLVLRRTEENKLQISMHMYESGKAIIFISNTSVEYSTWFHFVFISEMNNWSFYINGNLAGSSIQKDFHYDNQQRFILRIGNSQRQFSSKYSCPFDEVTKSMVIGIDDLRFYSRQLKSQEIQALYKNDPDPTKLYFN
ncbi:unnamed protein product [Adineta ricciae]|uniref:NAD(P)(+)--arginine ADP-ribosyltransferase n=1 Tax=Adineta ricciae TaxID=249248 RepID=A0A815IXZ0_ADIRI|nr:unnamed protein product [Adineta ricciae]